VGRCPLGQRVLGRSPLGQHRLGWGAYLFIAAVCGLATVLGCTLMGLWAARPVWSWWGAGILLIAMLLAEAGAAEITRDSEQVAYLVSVAAIPHLAAALLLPPPVGWTATTSQGRMVGGYVSTSFASPIFYSLSLGGPTSALGTMPSSLCA
jgi:hypothetical protein